MAGHAICAACGGEQAERVGQRRDLFAGVYCVDLSAPRYKRARRLLAVPEWVAERECVCAVL